MTITSTLSFICLISHNIFLGDIPRHEITKNKYYEHLRHLDTYSEVALKKGCTTVCQDAIPKHMSGAVTAYDCI